MKITRMAWVALMVTAFAFSFLPIASMAAEKPSVSPDALFGVVLHVPADHILESSPALAAGTDEELCSRYGYCVYAMPEPKARGLDYLNVTVSQGVIVKAEAAANISGLENPPCDAYAALVSKYGRPAQESVVRAFKAAKLRSYQSDGLGLVETPYDPGRFRDECARCVLKNGGNAVFLLDLRFAGNLRTVIGPDRIYFTLGDEAEAAEALRLAQDRMAAQCDADCRKQREDAAAMKSFEAIGLRLN